MVEDDLSSLQVSRRMLENLGYKAFVAATPNEAIHKAAEHAGEVHLLLTDVVMPKMNGRDLAQNLLSQNPSPQHPL